MNKEDILRQIRSLAARKQISKEELINAFDTAETSDLSGEILSQAGIPHILYYIGAAIVFIGVSVLIWQNWSTLSGFTKILSTLGVGIAAYITAVLLGRQKRFKIVSSAFYFISALVMPLGLHVVFYLAGVDTGSHGVQSIVSAILFLTFFLSNLVERKTIFMLFNIIFGTWLFFSFTNMIFSGAPGLDWHFSAYRVLCIGLTYGLLGYYYSASPHRALTGPLYGFGVLCFLGAAFALTGEKPHQNIFWELIFPGFVFAVMFLSVYLKSKAFLTFGSLFLIAYICKITVEYFADSLGWPLVLVLIGLSLIAIGYLYFAMKRKYLSKSLSSQ